MVLPGMNPETNLPGYDYARMAGLGAADFDFKALGSAMDCNREFAQAGIIYSDGTQRYLVRSGQRHPNGQSGIVTHVIVTKANSQPSTSSVCKSLTDAVTSTSMGTELASTVLSCGEMIITGGVMLAGTAATPLTAGGSGVLVAIGYAGTLATGLQCVNGLYRIYDLVENGGGNVAWLDTQEWYVATSTSLDVISLASAGGALKEAVTTWRAMKSISSLKATEWLKSYPRQDRARLTELIIRAQNPGISNKEIKALIRAGLYPKRFPTGPVQVELTRQLGQVVTSAAALAGSAVSGVIAAPSNLPRTGKYIIGTIQSLAVF
ncbi:hypothetical protein [Enterobacter roggenkampii]|uniref:hypothetical protein n=1 Tax=Enterobacter roggenkampii TaxID=1812935 RepID=UPI00244B4F2E|nr:hypothetical protein [Enterobacter roggenkampii]MDH2554048.1 hypothetical protein [Enterobacter roggenkampii]